MGKLFSSAQLSSEPTPLRSYACDSQVLKEKKGSKCQSSTRCYVGDYDTKEGHDLSLAGPLACVAAKGVKNTLRIRLARQHVLRIPSEVAEKGDFQKEYFHKTNACG